MKKRFLAGLGLAASAALLLSGCTGTGQEPAATTGGGGGAGGATYGSGAGRAKPILARSVTPNVRGSPRNAP